MTMVAANAARKPTIPTTYGFRDSFQRHSMSLARTAQKIEICSRYQGHCRGRIGCLPLLRARAYHAKIDFPARGQVSSMEASEIKGMVIAGNGRRSRPNLREVIHG